VDDLLPTKNGKLIYMHSNQGNEFWSALLEKAYAKLKGSYKALNGGFTSDAVKNLTGVSSQSFELGSEVRPDLLQIMLKAQKEKLLMECGFDAVNGMIEGKLDNGLIAGHTYSITDVRMVQTSIASDPIPMVRVRNPWGDSHEWKGAWSDGSAEWQSIPEAERKNIGLTFDNDGEFWMTFKDFVANFQDIDISHLIPDILDERLEGSFEGKFKWESLLFEGGWRRGVNAIGCRNYPETYLTNPHYHVTVTVVDSDSHDDNGATPITLKQKKRRKLEEQGKDNLGIEYVTGKDLHSDPQQNGEQVFVAANVSGYVTEFIIWQYPRVTQFQNEFLAHTACTRIVDQLLVVANGSV